MIINYDYGYWREGESKYGKTNQIETNGINVWALAKDIIRIKKNRISRIDRMKDDISKRAKSKHRYTKTNTKPHCWQPSAQYKEYRKLLREQTKQNQEIEAFNKVARTISGIIGK